jgi:hypothetical protein
VGLGSGITFDQDQAISPVAVITEWPEDAVQGEQYAVQSRNTVTFTWGDTEHSIEGPRLIRLRADDLESEALPVGTQFPLANSDYLYEVQDDRIVLIRGASIILDKPVLRRLNRVPTLDDLDEGEFIVTTALLETGAQFNIWSIVNGQVVGEDLQVGAQFYSQQFDSWQYYTGTEIVNISFPFPVRYVIKDNIPLDDTLTQEILQPATDEFTPGVPMPFPPRLVTTAVCIGQTDKKENGVYRFIEDSETGIISVNDVFPFQSGKRVQDNLQPIRVERGVLYGGKTLYMQGDPPDVSNLGFNSVLIGTTPNKWVLVDPGEVARQALERKLRLEMASIKPVIDVMTAPPETPVNGDRYLIADADPVETPTTPTGAWADHYGEIAEWKAGEGEDPGKWEYDDRSTYTRTQPLIVQRNNRIWIYWKERDAFERSDSDQVSTNPLRFIDTVSLSVEGHGTTYRSRLRGVRFYDYNGKEYPTSAWELADGTPSTSDFQTAYDAKVTLAFKYVGEKTANGLSKITGNFVATYYTGLALTFLNGEPGVSYSNKIVTTINDPADWTEGADYSINLPTPQRFLSSQDNQPAFGLYRGPFDSGLGYLKDQMVLGTDDRLYTANGAIAASDNQPQDTLGTTGPTWRVASGAIATGGLYVGEASTFGALPATRMDGSPLQEHDWALLSETDGDNAQGVYQWSGTAWGDRVPLVFRPAPDSEVVHRAANEQSEAGKINVYPAAADIGAAPDPAENRFYSTLAGGVLRSYVANAAGDAWAEIIEPPLTRGEEVLGGNVSLNPTRTTMLEITIPRAGEWRIKARHDMEYVNQQNTLYQVFAYITGRIQGRVWQEVIFRSNLPTNMSFPSSDELVVTTEGEEAFYIEYARTNLAGHFGGINIGTSLSFEEVR